MIIGWSLIMVVIVCWLIYNYQCNQSLSPLTLWVWIPLRRCVLDATLCDCQWLVAGQWFSLVSSTNQTDHQDITEILLKVALNTITLTLNKCLYYLFYQLSEFQDGHHYMKLFLIVISSPYYYHIYRNRFSWHNFVI